MKLHVKIEFEVEAWVVHFIFGCIGLGVFAACCGLAITVNPVFVIPAFIVLGWTLNVFRRGWDE